jgi:hypothetical protein
MRPVQELGLAPLNEKNIQDMLNQHIPYRLSLLRDGYRPPWIPPCQHTNQSFEAGSVSGRILLSLLGLGCDRNGALKPDQKHDAKDGQTDDVKVPDIGGEFVELESLCQTDKDALAAFIRGVNKACAHFTIDSDHQLNLQTYAAAGSIIFRLMTECFPNHAESWPKFLEPVLSN